MTWRIIPGEIGPEAQCPDCGNTHSVCDGGLPAAIARHECPAQEDGRDAE